MLTSGISTHLQVIFHTNDKQITDKFNFIFISLLPHQQLATNSVQSSVYHQGWVQKTEAEDWFIIVWHCRKWNLPHLYAYLWSHGLSSKLEASAARLEHTHILSFWVFLFLFVASMTFNITFFKQMLSVWFLQTQKRKKKKLMLL